MKLRTFDQLHRGDDRSVDGYDLIIIAVDNHGWSIDHLEILGHIRRGERLDRVESVLVTGQHAALQPPVVDQALRYLHTQAVETEERPRSDVHVKLSDATRHLTATGGEAHQYDLFQLEGLVHRGQVIDVVIHVVAIPGLARKIIWLSQLSEFRGQPWLNTMG